MCVGVAHVNVIRGDFLHWHIEVIRNFTQLSPGALIVDERDANTHSAKPSGPPDAVEVCGGIYNHHTTVGHHSWQIVIHNHRHSRNVNSARKDIGGDQNLRLSRTKVVDHAVSAA